MYLAEPVNMKIDAIIPYRNSVARYSILRESEYIYTATLLSYDGNTHDLPPVNITLTKGIRHWIGSTHIQILIDHIGEIIDMNDARVEDKSEDVQGEAVS